MKIEIPKELLNSIANKIEILHEAIDAEENPEQQIGYRMMAATGTFDSSDRGVFQIIVEICVSKDHFIDDGDIEIITDAIHNAKPYKIAPPMEKFENLQKENSEWKEECNRLAVVADFWQRKYNELNPGFQRPKIDNL